MMSASTATPGQRDVPRAGAAGWHRQFKTAKPGHRAVMIGSRTGKEGVAGAAFASSELTSAAPVLPGSQGNPSWQKTDRRLSRDHSKGLIVAMQDMGAAGIVPPRRNSLEKQHQDLVNVDLVPLKEKMGRR